MDKRTASRIRRTNGILRFQNGIAASAPTLVDAQITRILADGGTVVSREWMLTVVSKMLEQSIYSSCKFLGDANFAYKNAGAGACSKLYDISGNNNDAVQTTGANQPIWTTAQQNGKAGLVFDGAKYLLLPDTTRPAQNCSFLSVAKATRTATARTTIAHAYLLGAFYCRIEASTDGTEPNKFRFVINGASVYSTVDADQTTKLLGSWYDSSNQYCTVNGADQQSVANSSGVIVYNDSDNMTLGIMNSGVLTASGFVGSKMGDIIFNSALTTAQRQAMESLINRYYAVY